jgi:hypothetical protein
MKDVKVKSALLKIALGCIEATCLAITVCAVALAQSFAPASTPGAPEVRLDADGLAPRSIEKLTGTTIVRYYAQAWHSLAEALESSRTEGLGEEFVGSAKDRLLQRIGDQQRTGVHVRIVDRGHHLKAVFYSSDGSAMQLVDQSQLEIQTFDGNKMIATEGAVHQYVVLMTTGADRWYVRDLEEVSAKPF